ncbi:hypothetical protein NDI52_28615 [Leptolyngbya sp. PL-A3]|uniref:hypothetical protein n=1 Tax=Leptolyngbya sp. PL-A3 TaxID=2933911 RepID=UPI003296E8CB
MESELLTPFIYGDYAMLPRGAKILATAFLSTFSLISCVPTSVPQPPKTILISVDASTNEEVAFAVAFLDEFAFQTAQYQWLVVDVQDKSEVANYYSNTPRKEAVDEIIERLVQTPCDDQALISSLTHAKEYAQRLNENDSLSIVLLTEGTRNVATLSAVHELSQELSAFPHLKLFIAGVSEDNRLSLSQAFTPIDDQVQFFGNGLVELDELLRLLS